MSLGSLVARWLWKYQDAMVAKAVAAQLVQHNKDAEKRELSRELLALCVRAEGRAARSIALDDLLKTAANTAHNRPGAFRAPAHLARLESITARTAKLMDLKTQVEAVSQHDARTLQRSSADELNSRQAILLRMADEIEALAKAVDQEVRDALDEHTRRVEHTRRLAEVEEEAALRRRDST